MQQKWFFLLVVGLLAAAPFFVGPYPIHVLSEICLFAILAMSLDLMLGYTGLPSLGHGAFFGIGAYSVTILTVRFDIGPGPAVVLALAAVVIAALVVGYYCVRASGISFLMLTLAFSQLFYVVAHKWTSLTGGSDGLFGVVRPVVALPLVALDLSDRTMFYYLSLFLALGVFVLLRCLVRSPLGLVFIGIRENESRMRSIGFPARRFQVCSFVIASLLAGLAGVVYAFFNGFVSPQELYWSTSAMILVMLILGGAGTILGPVLGAAFVMGLQDFVSSTSEHWPMVVGAVFVLFILFVREGLLGAAQKSWRWLGWRL